jgi:DNA-binding CsgD family transcriptional regulator
MTVKGRARSAAARAPPPGVSGGAAIRRAAGGCERVRWPSGCRRGARPPRGRGRVSAGRPPPRWPRWTAESRAPLRAARNTFDALGIRPWADRSRQELRAAGENSRVRPATGRDELTPQELQIAQLAAQGLTNREIGQALYLSHRTVSTHLHNIFPKHAIVDAPGR